MMSASHILRRNVLYESAFHLFWRVVAGSDESQAVADTIDMCVNWHCRKAESNGAHDVGGLPANTRQSEQRGFIGGYFAAKLAHQEARHRHKMSRFGARIGHTSHVVKDFVLIRLSHRCSVGKTAKQLGRNHIDTLVGALRTENDGNKQLESAAKLKLGGYFGLALAEIIQHVLVSFSSRHGLFCVMMCFIYGYKIWAICVHTHIAHIIIFILS